MHNKYKHRVFVMLFILGLAMAGCSASGAELGGTTWTLTHLNGQTTLDGITAGLAFGEEGALKGNTGCNTFTSTYETNRDEISFTPAAMTLMACPQPQMDQESAFMEVLANVKTYNVQGTVLNFIDAEKNTIASFRKVEASSLALPGSAWTVTGYNNGKEAVVSVVVDSEITAVFGQNNMLSGNTGCNDYNVRYQVDGKNITVDKEIQMTKMACSEELMAQEQQYLAALQSAATFSIQLDSMELRTAEDALAVMLVR